jgi:hypothetical protein
VTLKDLSCASGAFCVAVGSYVSGGVSHTLAEHFDGSKWSVVTTPSQGSGSNELTAVSCSTASSCVASGVKGSAPVTLSWDGEGWAELSGTVKTFAAGQLSCPSLSSCLGIFGNPIMGYTAWHWDGADWNATSLLPDKWGRVVTWRGVSCGAVNRCIVGGNLALPVGTRPVFQKWNGTKWTLQTVDPEGLGEEQGAVRGVSCSSEVTCTAIAFTFDDSLAFRHSISLPPLVVTGAANVASSDQVTVKGVVNPEGKDTSYQVEYVGDADFQKTGWEDAVVMPVAPADAGSGTEDVQVEEEIENLEPGTGYHYRLIAENGEGTSVGAARTFATWGAWSLSSTANPKVEEKSSLADVSCWTATSCRAVGYDEYLGRSVVESLSGGNWSLGTGTAALKPSALSCPSSTHCTAIGEKTDGTPYTQQFLSAGGYAPVAPVTPEGGSALALKGVSCTTKYTCTMVGSYTKEGKTKPLIERFNEAGWAWALQTPATATASLADVSCASESECVAVGTEGSKPFAERWNGTSWSALTVPLPAGASSGSLTKVSCPSTSFCMASGTYGLLVPFAVSWDGSKWTLATSGLSALVGSAQDLSCTASNACSLIGTKESKTFAQRWSGTEWAAQSSPNPEGKTPALKGLSCPSATSCVAVGKATYGEGQSATLGLGYE